MLENLNSHHMFRKNVELTEEALYRKSYLIFLKFLRAVHFIFWMKSSMLLAYFYKVIGKLNFLRKEKNVHYSLGLFTNMNAPKDTV